MGSYDPIYVNTGLAGPAVTAESAAKAKAAGGTTVMMRVKDGAAPGWPGFFGWLAAAHPKFYDYARVSLPNIVEDRQSYAASGAGFSGYDPASGLPMYSDALDRGGDPASELMNGLGAADPALQDFSAPDLSNIAAMSLPQSMTEGITDSTPLQTTVQNNTIASTLAQAASAFLPLYQQQQVFKAQLDRAKAGLPPLDTSSVIDSNAGLNFGINPATQKTLLTFAGIAAAALLAHKLLGRSRR